MGGNQEPDEKKTVPLHGVHPQLEALVRLLARKAARALCKKEQPPKE